MQRRQFLQTLSLLGVAPAALLSCFQRQADMYTLPEFGNTTLLHFTDCHAQLLPLYFREPSVNIGIGKYRDMPPHLVGQQFLDFYGIKQNTLDAHAYTYLDFTEAARIFGKMGGFAHLATLIKQLRDQRGSDNTLLLDGGDSWQGSATALWTQGRDMVAACNLLGVDAMTGHWEFTYGSQQVLENLKMFKGQFLAQNIFFNDDAQFTADADTGRVFTAYTIKEMKNARIAVIGQAFPYTPIANPKRFIPNWQFGIDELKLQEVVDQIKQQKRAEAIVLLSHNGMDVDLKLASRVSGIDIILGGHTHDAVPVPVRVENSAGTTWVTNAGSHGKYLAVLDLQIKAGRMQDFRYHLLPVFSNLINPDVEMQRLIDTIRLPYLERLRLPLAETEELLFRRGNFYGSYDQLILDAQRAVNDAQIALSPGFRWGASLLPGQTITTEDVMNLTAITYPETYVRNMSGLELKDILEDVCDNLFNQDPYYQQGGDMVRVGGMNYACNPRALMGARITDLRLNNGELIDAHKQYRVSGWATVGQKVAGPPIWEIVKAYLENNKTIRFGVTNQPKIV